MRNVLRKHTYQVRKGEQITEPSMTVPDQALSLKKILSDYTRGVMPANVRDPEYHGEDYIPDLKTLDLSELAEYVESVKSEVDTLQKEQKRRQAEAEKQAIREEIRLEMEQAENQPVD